MKITKQRLREIIREELASMDEGFFDKVRSWGGQQRPAAKHQHDYSKRGDDRVHPAPSKDARADKGRFVAQPGRPDYSDSIAKGKRARRISKEQEALLNDPVFRAGAGIPQDATTEEALRMHRGEIPKPYSLEEGLK